MNTMVFFVKAQKLVQSKSVLICCQENALLASLAQTATQTIKHVRLILFKAFFQTNRKNNGHSRK